MRPRLWLRRAVGDIHSGIGVCDSLRDLDRGASAVFANQHSLELDFPADGSIRGPRMYSDAAGILGLQACNVLRTTALRSVRTCQFSGHAVPHSYPASSNSHDIPRDLWFCTSDVCGPSKPKLPEQALLVPDTTFWRMDLWPIREPQPLCRADGNVGPHCAGVRVQPLCARTRKVGCGVCGCANGSNHLLVWFARRDGCARGADCNLPGVPFQGTQWGTCGIPHGGFSSAFPGVSNLDWRKSGC